MAQCHALIVLLGSTDTSFQCNTERNYQKRAMIFCNGHWTDCSLDAPIEQLRRTEVDLELSAFVGRAGQVVASLWRPFKAVIEEELVHGTEFLYHKRAPLDPYVWSVISVGEVVSFSDPRLKRGYESQSVSQLSSSKPRLLVRWSPVFCVGPSIKLQAGFCVTVYHVPMLS